jgi:D-arabinose 1-dehydrogenase-like Zn-dependent alcohol dehydrogenase
MATLTWILTTFGPMILAALGKYVLDQHAQEQARADAQSLGAATTAAATNKETSDAMRRAADAAINAPRGSDLDDALASGARQF